MKELTEKVFLNAFKRSCENGQRFCFILGSGASKTSGIPTGAELANQWYTELFKSYSEAEVRALAKSLKITWTNVKNKNYFDLYNLLYYPIYENGYKRIEKLMENAKPSYGYYALAEHVSNSKNNVIITTNFDTLSEDTIMAATAKKPLILGHEALAGYIKMNMSRPIIAKVHRGLFFAPFNRRKDVATLPQKWKDALREVFRQYTPIVIGYSGGDEGFMNFLKDSETPINEFYWCYRKNETPSDDIKELAKKKDGYFIPIDENYGFDMLMLQIKNYLEHKNPCEYLKKITDERIQDYNEAEALLTEALNAIQNPDEAQSDVRSTLEEINDKEILRLLEELEFSPNDADKCASLAYRYSKNLSDFENALKWYSKAIEINPKFARAYFNRGIIHRKLNENDKAIADYTKAIELDPNYVAAYNNRGTAYDDLKEYDKAIADYTKAIELDPSYVRAHQNRGITHRKLGKYDKAIADYTKAIELDQNYVAAYNNRGFVYYNLKEYDKAFTDYTKAIELDPSYVKAYRNRADSYDALNMSAEAEADRKKAKELKAK